LLPGRPIAKGGAHLAERPDAKEDGKGAVPRAVAAIT